MHVEIWSDIACPWCYIGKRRFEAALTAFEHRDDVTVTWRSFQLDPSAPAVREGGAAELLMEKLETTREEVSARLAQVTALAAAEGLEYRFDLQRPGNTFDAHRLVHLGRAHGIADAVNERLFHGYFSEGAAIGDPADLERLAVDAGLPKAEVHELLLTERYAEDVRDDQRTAASLGITGVPFFVVDRSVAVSGAQPPELLGELLRRAMPTAPDVRSA
ncbi:MAG TPA: DsbA family oxidoreductase [Solirubrobacteraceae bacterium]